MSEPVVAPGSASEPMLPGFSASALELYKKWNRDSSLPVTERLRKAQSVALDRFRARLYLRRAEVGARVRVAGRPRITIKGALRIGDDCFFRSLVAPIELYVSPGATMSLGRRVRINSGTTLSSSSQLVIGDRVEIGPHVTIHDNSFHELYDREMAPESRPVIIEDDVWLASRCTVLPGVRIGRGAVVVANALVTRNVEPFTVVSGVPAAPIAHLNPKKFIIRS
jgi:maltose O-acetyltransferase